MDSKIDVLVTPAQIAEDMKQVEAAVDRDIDAFDAYFRSLGNDPLVRSEKAIIKTYLHWKTKGASDGAATGS